MTALIILNLLFIPILLCALIYLFVKFREFQNSSLRVSSTATRITDHALRFKVLLGIAGFVLFFSFIAPFLFTRSAPTQEFDFRKTGEIGDTIGGLMNPLLQ
jgi:hypothetical protein